MNKPSEVMTYMQNFEVVKAEENVSLLYIRVMLNDREFFGMLDTGATLSAISNTIIKEAGLSSKVKECRH